MTMHTDTYFDKLFARDGKHDKATTFFQSLYVIIQQKETETPTYALFLECLIEAYQTESVWNDDAQREMFGFDRSNLIIEKPKNDWEALLFFVLAEADFFYRASYSTFLYKQSVEVEVDLFDVMYDKIPAFLEEALAQNLFSHSGIYWNDFLILLKRITHYNPFARLESIDAQGFLHCLLLHPALSFTKEESVFFAWIGAKWCLVYTDRFNQYEYTDNTLTYKLYPDYEDMQVISEEWWSYLFSTAPQEIRQEIRRQVLRLLSQHFLPDEAEGLLKAAEFFYVAYPEIQGIGNADGVFYDDDVPRLWEQYKPYSAYFEAFLGKSELFDNEFITIAQVLWLHYRWTSYFSEEAVGYFLKKAVELNPTVPIQYIKLETYSKKTDAKKEHHLLQSNQGLTYYCYADFLYYHEKDYAKALAYYEQFVTLEPCLLPYNLIPLDVHYVREFMYPPSTQMALAQIAQIYRLQKDYAKAKMYAKEAIALRENNFQTPYELLAEMLEEEGDLKGAIALYEQKVKAMEQCIIKGYWSEYSVENYPVYSLEEKGSKSLYYGQYFRAKVVSCKDFREKIARL